MTAPAYPRRLSLPVLVGDRDSGRCITRVGEGDGDLRLAGCLRGLAVELQPRRLAADDLDLPGRHRPAQSLDHRLLRGEPGRQMAARTGALARIGQLGVGEQPLREPRTSLQGALDPLDLDQVDADAERHDARAYLSPTTAFSSAWSPLLPEPVTR